MLRLYEMTGFAAEGVSSRVATERKWLSFWDKRLAVRQLTTLSRLHVLWQ